MKNSVYETIYQKLALKGEATISPASGINVHSVRVGWYKWRKLNSLILGKKAEYSIRASIDSAEDTVKFEILDSTQTQLEFDLL